MREILSAAAAAGISVAFGAPIGGVVFSLEEMSYYFSSDTMWHSFFCAMAAAVALKLMDPFRTEKLVVFQVQYDRDWHGFEMMFYLVLGILGVWHFCFSIASLGNANYSSSILTWSLTLFFFFIL